MTNRRRKRRGPLATIALHRRHATATCALAAAGLVISVYLTYVYHHVQADSGWQSICAISSTLNCDTVVSSTYGTLLGAPLSVYAAWFYALTVVLAVAGRWPRRRIPRSSAVLLLLAGAFAFALSVALAFVSAAWIGSLCLLCAVLYLVNLGILLVAWRALRATAEPLRQALSAERLHAQRHRGSAAVVVGGSLALLAMIPWAYSDSPARQSMICDILADPAFEPPLTVVVYSDFQCPHCRTLDRSLRPLREVTGLRLIPRHYPLDNACNPQVKRSRHPGACLQARAAICAGAQGRYDDFSDRLFGDGPAHVTGLIALATSLGLDRSRFETCLWSQWTGDELAASIREAVAAGARGTPTVLVNGQRHAGTLSTDEIACLDRATRPTPSRSGSSRRGTLPRQPWYAARRPASGTLTIRPHQGTSDLVRARSPPPAAHACPRSKVSQPQRLRGTHGQHCSRRNFQADR